MAQALAAAAPAILGAFNNQGRRHGAGQDRPKVDSALPILAAAEKKKLKKLQKEADREKLYNLLAQPEVLGLVITLGGLFASQVIPFSSDRETNMALQSTAATASVLLGLGHAGVGDLTTLIIAAAAGGGSLLGSLIGDDGQMGLPGLNPSLGWKNMIPGYGLYEMLK